MNDFRNCLSDVLRLIDNLQKCVLKEDSFDNSCSRPLGIGSNISYFNTRPVMFFSCDNTQLSITYYVNGTPNTSNVFRIEDVNDSCVTVRLLATNPDGSFSSTNETAIININCICAIKCLGDISLDL